LSNITAVANDAAALPRESHMLILLSAAASAAPSVEEAKLRLQIEHQMCGVRLAAKMGGFQ
jgi:hypothetical protein